MKKFLITLALIVPVLAFTACGDDDDEPKTTNELVGTTWACIEEDVEDGYYISETLSFESNTKCVYTLVEKEDGETVTDMSLNGVYSYKKPIVTVKLTYNGENATMRL